MLKIIYTETGLHVEIVDQPIAAFVRDRLAIENSVGAQLAVESGWASLLVGHLPGVAALAAQPGIAVSRADDQSIEVSFSGIWLAGAAEAEEGVFVAELPGDLEERLAALWRTLCSCRIVP
ncbi:alr0857 family protein [Gloeobacter kilaueensis]|uniref:Uncharacterized protein n=1 Tax=Gloeobacter kilaueensis (strain ATCC BAA-2537 / CCAP 1431/1 / ULC 316 / JS1) TaxID=1183438 RepID=U5QJL2_GLOK1|nr:alr0857 family protein [Gloeobacter kilaueensis]AGY59116.1 hypothetical protein GKIL_2870 [Gloeobacter kilaueensis JS1]